CSILELTSFTAAEAERLIELKLAQLVGGDERPSATLLERISGRAQGNPFYIEELLNYLHDCGLDRADARALEQLELPASLHSLVLSRIDQLSESQKITLRVASIIGRQFRKSWLWGARPELGTAARVQADLDELSILDLTPLDQPEPEAIYLFKHIVTREAAYESLPYATRALLHGQLGQFIEDAYAEEVDQYVDLLAYHYDQSGIVPKKRAYLRRAGEAAQAAYANEAAIDYYQRVLPLLSDDERVVTLLTLGQVLELVGNWSEAGDCYHQALRQAEELDDPQAQASARRAMGWLLRKRGEYHAATSWLVEARAGYEQLGDLAAVSQVMTDIGEVARQLGAYTEAQKWYDDALSLAASVAERGPRLMAQAQALKGAGTLAAKQGDNAAARMLYEQSLAIRRELGDRPGVAVLLSNLGIVARYTEDYAESRHMNEESLAVFREIGDRWTVGTLLNNLGCVAADMSDYAAARQILAESMEVRRQLGDQGGLAFSLNSLADVLLDEGDHLAARPLLEESLTINVDLGDRAAIAYLLDDFAALATAEGQPERALQLAGAAAAANEQLGAQLPAGERARFERLQASARQALGEHRATMAWEQGRMLTLEQAVEYALARLQACD
ncbi:MAG: ATP-binding protein, partial [Chloroflexota bacterium]